MYLNKFEELQQIQAKLTYNRILRKISWFTNFDYNSWNMNIVEWYYLWMIYFYLKTRINDELLLKEIINESEDFYIL